MALSNTFTNTDPELIVQSVLPAFTAGLTPVSAFSTNYAAEAAQKGASIQVPVITAKTANTSSFTTYEDGNTTVVGTQVILNVHARSFSGITDVEAGKTAMEIEMAAARENAYAVGLSVYQTVIGNIVAGTFGDTANTSKLVVTAANFNLDSVAQAVTFLKKRNARGDISLIMDLDYAGYFMQDNQVQNASALGSDEMVRQGAVGRILGVNVYETNAFPTALTNENTGAMVVVPSALAIAVRPVVPQSAASQAGVEFATATDPATGLTLGYRRFYNSATGQQWAGFEVLFGVTAVQAAGAVRIVSA